MREYFKKELPELSEQTIEKLVEFCRLLNLLSPVYGEFEISEKVVQLINGFSQCKHELYTETNLKGSAPESEAFLIKKCIECHLVFSSEKIGNDKKTRQKI